MIDTERAQQIINDTLNTDAKRHAFSLYGYCRPIVDGDPDLLTDETRSKQVDFIDMIEETSDLSIEDFRRIYKEFDDISLLHTQQIANSYKQQEFTINEYLSYHPLFLFTDSDQNNNQTIENQ